MALPTEALCANGDVSGICIVQIVILMTCHDIFSVIYDDSTFTFRHFDNKADKTTKMELSFVIAGSRVQLPGRRPGILNEGSRGFPQRFEANAWLAPQIRP
jgi:hypothetical protein